MIFMGIVITVIKQYISDVFSMLRARDGWRQNQNKLLQCFPRELAISENVSVHVLYIIAYVTKIHFVFLLFHMTFIHVSRHSYTCLYSCQRHFPNYVGVWRVQKTSLWMGEETAARLGSSIKGHDCDTYRHGCAPLRASSWQAEGCRWDTALWSSGSRCCPGCGGRLPPCTRAPI